MKYSDFVHESEIKHNTISYDLLTPKPLKSGEVKQDKIKIDFPKAISLLAPYTYVRVLEQIKAVVPLAAYLFLFQLLQNNTEKIYKTDLWTSFFPVYCYTNICQDKSMDTL